MKVVGQRNVDGVDRRVGQQRVIIGEDTQRGVERLEPCGLGRVGGGDGHQFRILGLVDGGGHVVLREV